MIKYLLSVLCCIVILISLSWGLTFETKTKVAASTSDFFIGLNEYRRGLGLSPIYENAKLNTAAKAKVEEIFATGKFEHTNPMSKYPVSQGYAFFTLGELLANNFWDEAGVLSGWKASSPHNALLTKANFCEGGYYLLSRVIDGVDTSYAALFLGAPSSGCTSITLPIVPSTSEAAVTTASTPTITANSTVYTTSSFSTANEIIPSSASLSYSSTIIVTDISQPSSSSSFTILLPESASVSTVSMSESSKSSVNTTSLSKSISIEGTTKTVLQAALSTTANTSKSNTVQVIIPENTVSSTSTPEVLHDDSTSTENTFSTVQSSIQLGSISSQTQSVSEDSNNNPESKIQASLSLIKTSPIMVNNMVGYYYKNNSVGNISLASIPKYTYLGSYEIVNMEQTPGDFDEPYIIAIFAFALIIISFTLIKYWKKRIELI